MEFKKYVPVMERFVAKKFFYDEKDAGENELRTIVEEFIEIANRLDAYKKKKYYNKTLPPGTAVTSYQTSIQEFSRTEEAEKLLHAALGLCTESCEILESLYKAKWGGKEFDKVNLKEELGDIFFYLAILFREVPELALNDVLQVNHDKLDKRYGKEFSTESAINRDLKAERDILEGK